MLVIMPSALNLPQANPSTVLEYAPVPPDKNEPPPPQVGSLSSLGLGSSNTLSAGTKPPVPPVGKGNGKTPITKQCIGDPPRQTEDPNSPPCVPFFQGSNGGATWQGVSKDQITILLYTSGGTITTGNDTAPEQSPNDGTYCDADAKPNSNPNCFDTNSNAHDHYILRDARALSRYFNERFQTYGRHVHLWVYYSNASATPGIRRADAQDNWEKLKPFAVIDYAYFGGYNSDYDEAMTRRRIAVISNFAALPNSLYRQNQPYLWTFWPDVEHWADQYFSYLCAKVVPNKVSHSGNSGDMGKTRRYGLLSTSNDGYPGFKQFADMIASKLAAGCPGEPKPDIAGRWYFPNAIFSVDNDPNATTSAQQNVAEMRAKNVTTVLVLGGTESETGKAMDSANWLPEIVIAGDLNNDIANSPTYEDQTAWRHAWVVSNLLREDKRQDVPCKQAYREADPYGSQDDEVSACVIYRSMFMLFRSIQVAGPYLSPGAVDQGNHAVPRVASNDPYTAACFFDPGDYSCVKDAVEEWWDPDAPYPGGTNPANNGGTKGCWKMINEGKRYLSGTWPKNDVVFKNPNDICNDVEGIPSVNTTGGL